MSALRFHADYIQAAVNALIGQRFDAVSSGATAPVDNHHAPTNGVVKSIEKPVTPVSPPHIKKAPSASQPKRSPPSDDDSDLSDPRDTPKPKKKRKQATVEEDDAAFAARLQDEENRLARPTRGGGTRKRAPTKAAQKKKKKSSTKIRDDDDSSKESGSEAEPKERKGGFHVSIRQTAWHIFTTTNTFTETNDAVAASGGTAWR